MVEKEKLDVRLNSNLVKVVRTQSRVQLHFIKGLVRKVETCGFLVWAAPMLEFPTPDTTERFLFGSQKTVPYSSSLVNLWHLVRHSPSTLYHQNIVTKAEHGPLVMVDFMGLLAPNITTKEGVAAYNEATDEVTTAVVVQIGKKDISQRKLNWKLLRHYRQGFNVTDVEFVKSKTWDYFARWSPAETYQGRHWQVFDIQGLRRTWYIGASVSFESVKSVLEYNNLLLRQMVPGRKEEKPEKKMTEPETRPGAGQKKPHYNYHYHNYNPYHYKPRRPYFPPPMPYLPPWPVMPPMRPTLPPFLPRDYMMGLNLNPHYQYSRANYYNSLNKAGKQ